MGGCGCGGTVQYAPPACNPNFPTTCSSLGEGNIVRVVGEDSASCKYTVPTFSPTAANLKGSSILAYSGKTSGLTAWADGSSNAPIYIADPDGTSYGQTSSSTVGAIQGTTPAGQLVAFNPSFSAETQFPVVAPGGATTAWGTIESIVPNAGVVYRPGSGTGASGLVSQAYGTEGQVLTWKSNSAVFANAVTPAFIDAQAISLIGATTTTVNVSFGSLVFQPFSNTSPNSAIVQNGNGSIFPLNIYGTAGLGSVDVTSTLTNKYFYVYAIYNSVTSAFNVVASLSPTIPSTVNFTSGGNYYYRLIGLFYTNASSTAGISTKYNQQGRNVNLGKSNAVSVVTIPAGGSLPVYYSGPLTSFLPSSTVVNQATLNFFQNGAVTPKVTIQISDFGSSSPTSGTQTVVPQSNETYGAAFYSTSGTYASSINFECFVPNGSSFYNINQDVAYSVTSTLSIIGFKLSIF